MEKNEVDVYNDDDDNDDTLFSWKGKQAANEHHHHKTCGICCFALVFPFSESLRGNLLMICFVSVYVMYTYACTFCCVYYPYILMKSGFHFTFFLPFCFYETMSIYVHICMRVYQMQMECKDDDDNVNENERYIFCLQFSLFPTL